MTEQRPSKPVIVNDMSRFVIVELPAPVTHDEREQIAQRIASALEGAPEQPPAELRVFLCSEEYGCNLVPGEYYWRKDVDALLAKTRASTPPAAQPSKELVNDLRTYDPREMPNWCEDRMLQSADEIERLAKHSADVEEQYSNYHEWPPATAHEPCSAPVAWVPIHPTTGPLWANTIASKDSDHPRSYPLMPLYATQPPAEQPSVTEIIRQMRGRAAASDAGGTIEVLLSDLRSVVTGMQRAAQPPVPVVHGVVYDRGGWICSICHGWNCLKEKHCQHVHSGSAATKGGEQS